MELMLVYMPISGFVMTKIVCYRIRWLHNVTTKRDSSKDANRITGGFLDAICSLNQESKENNYSETKIVDWRNDKRVFVRFNFSSASAAFSRTPRTTSSGAFSTNCRQTVNKGQQSNMHNCENKCPHLCLSLFSKINVYFLILH